MRPTYRPAVRPLLAAVVVVATLALPALGEALSVSKAKAWFRVSRKAAEPRHRLLLEGDLASADDVHRFDPATHALRVEIAGRAVVDVPAGADAGGFKAIIRRGELRKWRYRATGIAGAAGKVKVVLDARHGRFEVRIRKAGLAFLETAGPRDVVAAVEVGGTRHEAQFSFQVVRAKAPARWRYPAPAPADGPVAYTSIVTGSLPSTPRPAVEAARDADELATLWAALGNPTVLPQVDFDVEMVVVVSALIEGAGVSGPPILDVTGARYVGGRLELDWRLRGCEFNLCPGAPAPVTCPQDTPFHVLRTARSAPTPRLVQKPFLGVCP